MPRIVFVGHNASRTGAPIALLHFLRWLRRESDFDAELLLLSGGPLVDAYREALPTEVARGRIPTIAKRGLDSMARRSGYVPSWLPSCPPVRELASRCGDADLIYLNTGEPAALLHAMQPGPCVLVHLHEGAYALRHIAYVSPTRHAITEDEYWRRTLDLSDAVIVPSEATRQQVLSLDPSGRERCQVIPEMVDIQQVRATTGDRTRVLKDLGIPEDALVVAACGWPDWRKGIDLFPQVAARVSSPIRSRPTYFLWIGASPVPAKPPAHTIDWIPSRQLAFDVERLGIRNRVVTIPWTQNVSPYLASADLFLLPSREDPFPLVAIEAAALGRPVVCFASSGTAEMVGQDAGAVVPHLDVVAMAAAVQTFLDDERKRVAAGEVAADRALRYDVSKIAPRLLTMMEETIRARSTSSEAR